MNTITDRLALIIDAKTEGLVTEVRKGSKSVEDLAVAEARATASTSQLAAATDKLSVAEARLEAVQAKASGDLGRLVAAREALTGAEGRAAMTKGEAAVAANALTVAELQAKAAAEGLGASAAGSGGLLESMGMKGAVSGDAIAAAMTKAGPLIAAVLAAKVLKDGVKGFEELTGQVREFQLVTGATAQQASLLVGRMRDLSIDPDNASKAMFRFVASIGDGTTKLGQYGIAAQRDARGNLDFAATFESVRKAYSSTTDAAQRDAIAKAVAARQGVALIPLLAQTTAEVKGLDAATRSRGEVFSQREVDQGHALKVATTELGQSFQGLEITLAKGIVPLLVEAEQLIRPVVDGIGRLDRLASSSGRGGGFLEALTGGKTGPVGLWESLVAVKDRNIKADAQAKVASEEAARATVEHVKAVDGLRSALESEVSAQRSVRDAAESVDDARLREVDATKALSKLEAQGAVDQKAVAAAKRDLASASEGVARAEEAAANAVAALNKARERASALDTAEAQSKAALAGDRIGQAKAREQQARERLDALEGSGSASASELAAGQADLKTAHDEVAQAVLDEQKAQADLQAVKQKGTEQDEAVKSAEQRVADAHRSVLDAVARRGEAEARLREAEAPDPDFQAKVAAATRAVARAHEGVADAQTGQVTASLALQTQTDRLNESLTADSAALAEVNAQLDAMKAKGLDVSAYLAQLLAAQAGTKGQGGPPGPGASLADLLGYAVTSGVLALALAPPPPDRPGRRAMGGRVEPGRDYLVGEEGPELLSLGAAGGVVLSNRDLSRAALGPAGALKGGDAAALGPRGRDAFRAAPAAAPAQAPRAGAVLHGPLIEQHIHADAGADLTRLALEAAREAAWSLRTTVLPHVESR